MILILDVSRDRPRGYGEVSEPEQVQRNYE